MTIGDIVNTLDNLEKEYKEVLGDDGDYLILRIIPPSRLKEEYRNAKLLGNVLNNLEEEATDELVEQLNKVKKDLEKRNEIGKLYGRQSIFKNAITLFGSVNDLAEVVESSPEIKALMYGLANRCKCYKSYIDVELFDVMSNFDTLQAIVTKLPNISLLKGKSVIQLVNYMLTCMEEEITSLIGDYFHSESGTAAIVKARHEFDNYGCNKEYLNIAALLHNINIWKLLYLIIPYYNKITVSLTESNYWPFNISLITLINTKLSEYNFNMNTLQKLRLMGASKYKDFTFEEAVNLMILKDVIHSYSMEHNI